MSRERIYLFPGDDFRLLKLEDDEAKECGFRTENEVEPQTIGEICFQLQTKIDQLEYRVRRLENQND